MTIAAPTLDLRRLEQFLMVTQLGSVSAAADHFGFSQQALSSSIRQLERNIGVALFDRDRRSLRLTAAGEELRTQAPMLLAATAHAVKTAIDAANNERREFRVGRTPAITSEESYRYLESVRNSDPTLSVTVLEIFPSQIEGLLQDGTIDVALRRGPMSQPALASAVIGSDQLNVAMRSSHPLATRSTLSLRELADETFIVWAPPGRSCYTDHLVSECRRHGIDPILRVNHIQGTRPETAVADNTCIAFVTAAPGTALDGAVRIIALEEDMRAPVQALWLPHIRSAPLDALVATETTTSDDGGQQ